MDDHGIDKTKTYLVTGAAGFIGFYLCSKAALPGVPGDRDRQSE